MIDTIGILKAISPQEAPHIITVIFRNGQKATYTTNIIEILKTDPAVKEIIDNETGELLYY